MWTNTPGQPVRRWVIKGRLSSCSTGAGGENWVSCDWRALGHRIVHGGRKLTQPVRVDDDVLAGGIARAANLLHQPHSIAAIRAVTRECAPIAAASRLFRRRFIGRSPLSLSSSLCREN